MKWITHQTGAVAAGLALQMPLLAVGAAFAGAILPDVLDQSISRMGRNKKQRQKIFNRIHRGNSHWFGWWLGLFIVSAAAPLSPVCKALCAGLAMGATHNARSAASALHAQKQGLALSLFHRQNGGIRFSGRHCRGQRLVYGRRPGCRGNEYCQRLEPGALAQELKISSICCFRGSKLAMLCSSSVMATLA